MASKEQDGEEALHWRLRGNLGLYAGAKKPKRAKIPGHRIQAAHALERKYQETLGEIAKLEDAEYEWVGREGFGGAEQWWRDRLKRLHETLMTLEKSIRMFDPKWERKALMTPYKLGTPRRMPRGVFYMALIRTITAAEGPLLVSELAARTATNLGLPMDRRDQRQRHYGMASNALKGLRKQGYVGCTGSPAKWFALPKNQDEGSPASR